MKPYISEFRINQNVTQCETKQNFKINLMFWDYSTLSVLTCHILTDMVRVIEGKII